MEILCPLRASSEVAPLVRAGAREFYAGVASRVLFGPEADASPILNCRPWPGCNFETEEDLARACAFAQGAGAKLYLAFNWYAYRAFELERIVDFLGHQSAIAGVILADLALIRRVRQRLPELPITLGTVAEVRNHAAVGFFLARGVQRFVLPRHLTVDEIRALVRRHPTARFEVFVKNQDCYFSQGHCYYTHDRFAPVPFQCNSLLAYRPSRPLSSAEVARLAEHGETLHQCCGVCALAALRAAGVAAVKLVGRELPLAEKIRDFAFVRQALVAAETDADSTGYRGAVQALYHATYGTPCRRDCLY